MMLVLVVLALAAQSLIPAFESYKNTQRHLDAAQTIRQLEAAFDGYMLQFSNWPCPDVDQDGKQDRIDGRCFASVGGVPFLDLNMAPKLDPWQRPFYYQVNAEAKSAMAVANYCAPVSVFADEIVTDYSELWRCASPVFEVCDASALSCHALCDQACVANPPSETLAANFGMATLPVGLRIGRGNLKLSAQSSESLVDAGVVGVVISWGPDGGDLHTQKCAGSSASLYPLENCDGDNDFIWLDQQQHPLDYVLYLSVQKAKSTLLQGSKDLP